MATKRIRKTAEQLLADYQDKVAKLQEKLDKKKTANLIKLGEAVQKLFGENTSADNLISVINDCYLNGNNIRKQCNKSETIQNKISALLNANTISQEIYDKMNDSLKYINDNMSIWGQIYLKWKTTQYDDSKADQVIAEILNYLNPPVKTSKKKNSTKSKKSTEPQAAK